MPLHGYRQVWAERHYLARLALVPVAVQFICTLLVAGMGAQHDFIRKAILSLPALLTQGWMLSHMVRLSFYGQRWPFQPTGDNAADERVLRERFRGIMAGTVVFALCHFLAHGVLDVVFRLEQQMADAKPEDVSIGAFFLALGLMIGAIWAMRLLWLFIPAALNYPIGRFLRGLGRFGTSFYIIGAWLVTAVPLMFVFQLVLGGLVSQLGAVPRPFEFILTLAQVMVSTATALVATAAMCRGLREVIVKNGG